MECTRRATHESCGSPNGSPPPPVRAFLGLVRLVHGAERSLSAQLREHRLNAGQFDLLLNVGAAEGLTQQELAERLCHSKANVSQLLDKMECTRLVRRIPQGRAYGLHLTDAGRALLDLLIPEHERIIAAQFAQLTPAEQGDLFYLVGKLNPSQE